MKYNGLLKYNGSPYFYILDIHQLVMKKIAALVETTGDRVATREPSAQLKSSAFKYTQ